MKCFEGFWSLLKFEEVCAVVVAIKQCKVNFLHFTTLSYVLKFKCLKRVSRVQPLSGTFIHITSKLDAGV